MLKSKFINLFFLLTLFGTPSLKGAIIDGAEVRVAAFFPSSHRFRSIYGDVGVNYQIELVKEIDCCCNEFWLNFDWYSDSGKVKHCGKSSISIANWSLGPKFYYCFCDCFYLYAGIGPSFGWVWLENKIQCCSSCSYEKNKYSRFVFGAVARTGLQYYFCNCLFADIFVDYLYEVLQLQRHTNIGGLKVGLGVGFSF